MKIRWARFNIYLLLSVGLALLPSACRTAEGRHRRLLSTLRVHMEARADGSDRNKLVPIYRAQPVMINVERDPLLTEADVAEAKIIDEPGGFSLRIKFNRQGKLLLEQYSAANRGKHLAIFSEFVWPPESKTSQGRWLAAPKIAQRLGDGALVFTPDATRDEAEEIVHGLNNVARKMENVSK